jgi:four helix bundle protein
LAGKSARLRRVKVESWELRGKDEECGYYCEDGGTEGRIESFEDLHAWKFGFRIAKQVYEVTKTFPEAERYGLSAQIRRSASSIPANIAEGFGRHAYKEYLRFLAYARGSIAETQSHLRLAHAVGFLSESDFSALHQLCVEARKTLQGLIRHVRGRMGAAGVAESSLDYDAETLNSQP